MFMLSKTYTNPNINNKKITLLIKIYYSNLLLIETNQNIFLFLLATNINIYD